MELETYQEKPKTWRYILDAVVFAGYLFWMLFSYNWFSSGIASGGNSCGAANGAVIVFAIASVFIASFYFLI